MLALCRLAELPDGGVRMVEAQDDAAVKLLLIREGEVVRAFHNACPHFGVPLAARQEQLIFALGQSLTCNTHYARFRWSDGLCVRGDCEGESLRPAQVALRDGVVYLVASD